MILESFSNLNDPMILLCLGAKAGLSEGEQSWEGAVVHQGNTLRGVWCWGGERRCQNAAGAQGEGVGSTGERLGVRQVCDGGWVLVDLHANWQKT